MANPAPPPRCSASSHPAHLPLCKRSRLPWPHHIIRVSDSLFKTCLPTSPLPPNPLSHRSPAGPLTRFPQVPFRASFSCPFPLSSASLPLTCVLPSAVGAYAFSFHGGIPLRTPRPTILPPLPDRGASSRAHARSRDFRFSLLPSCRPLLLLPLPVLQALEPTVPLPNSGRDSREQSKKNQIDLGSKQKLGRGAGRRVGRTRWGAGSLSSPTQFRECLCLLPRYPPSPGS